MALLKYFAPSKTFNVHVRIHKHMTRLWVWLHLTGLSLKIETFEVTNPRKFSPSKISRYTVFSH